MWVLALLVARWATGLPTILPVLSPLSSPWGGRQESSPSPPLWTTRPLPPTPSLSLPVMAAILHVTPPPPSRESVHCVHLSWLSAHLHCIHTQNLAIYSCDICLYTYMYMYLTCMVWSRNLYTPFSCVETASHKSICNVFYMAGVTGETPSLDTTVHLKVSLTRMV